MLGRLSGLSLPPLLEVSLGCQIKKKKTTPLGISIAPSSQAQGKSTTCPQAGMPHPPPPSCT